MPELPDVTIYLEALRPRVLHQPIIKVKLISPFFLRSTAPPVAAVEGTRVIGLERLGKRVVFVLEESLFVVFHLMIAGRFRWREKGAKVPAGKPVIAHLLFPTGTLVVTEAGSKKRASLHLVQGRESLAEFNPGGIEVLDASLEAFRAALLRENHTLKRSLTDPRLFSGIGNAYSDEILHQAQLSPLKLTQRLSEEEISRLYQATQKTLTEWIRRLRDEVGTGFPEKVTAFREGMAVHGRYRLPCPACSSPVQRIAYAENEANYCPTCQTGGKLLADRALSRLLKQDWPRSLEEMETLKRKQRKE